MPMTYTDKDVLELAQQLNLPHATAAEAREALARRSEEEYQDHVDAWELRTGRPWNTMTREEAEVLCRKHPECRRNHGVLLRLRS